MLNILGPMVHLLSMVTLFLIVEVCFGHTAVFNPSKVSLQTNLERNSMNSSYISILSVNFENLTVRLYVLIIFFVHVKFQEN